MNFQGFDPNGRRHWFGVDPGGIGQFGIALLFEDGSYDTKTGDSVDDANRSMKERPEAIGLDSPLWWSAGRGGGRAVDSALRKRYKIASGTVQSVNSLRGAALTQSLLFIEKCRERFPDIPASESHPKALLLALNLDRRTFDNRFGLMGRPKNEHEHDAVIGALVAREGFEGRWQHDLSVNRGELEQDPKSYWLKPVHYFWPEEVNT